MMMALNVILSGAARRSRRILITGLFVLVACTDYVGQIDDQIDEYNASARTREESSIVTADYLVDPSTVSVGEFKDSRDNHIYKMVTIGSQTWMAENLNYKVDGSYCYDDADSNCVKYGRLYTWAAAMDSVGKFSTNGKGCGFGKLCAPTYPVRGVCPDGWHFPSTGEWYALSAAFGRYYSSCETDTTGVCSLFTEDSYHFSVVFGGARSDDGMYYSAGTGASFWHSTENSNNRAHIYGLISDRGMNVAGDSQKDIALSVRCVKDVTEKNPESSSSVDESSSSADEQEDENTQSSGSVDVSSVPCEEHDLWCKNSVYRVVNTGMEAPEGMTVNADDFSNWWVEDDHENGGNSDIEWPAARGNEYNDLAFDSIVEYCKGLCGTVNLVKGDFYNDPFVEIGFDIPHSPVDVSDWEGVCITYTVSGQASLVLRLDDDMEDSIAYDVPAVSLSEASVPNEKCFAWSDFGQGGWGMKRKNLGGEAAKILKGMAFMIQDSDGTSADFNIIRLRKFNSYGKTALAPILGTLKDPRDGMTYKTVRIASQTWLAENLRYKADGSYCREDPDDCERYGRYYTWAAAMDSVALFGSNGAGCGYGEVCTPSYPVRGACPVGWHLPRESEFMKLVRLVTIVVGDEHGAADALKSTSGWQYHEIDQSGTDAYGFNILPAGQFSDYSTDYSDVGNDAWFWTSDGGEDTESSIALSLAAEPPANLNLGKEDRNHGFSVRCVMN
ncbi:FISUMP domain-containing protein [Fibrobacter sp.]